MNKVRPGAPLRINAGDWNRLLELADLGPRDPRQPSRARAGDLAVVPLKNASGADRLRGEVLAFGAPLFDPTSAEGLAETQRTRAFSGVLPGAEQGRFCVLLEPAAEDAIADAAAAGVVAAKVNVSDEAHRFADVADGLAVLASGATGAAEILYKPAGTGEAWCLVRLGTPGGGGDGDGKTKLDAGDTLDYLASRTGFDAETKQALIHEAAGGLAWQNIGPCST